MRADAAPPCTNELFYVRPNVITKLELTGFGFLTIENIPHALFSSMIPGKRSTRDHCWEGLSFYQAQPKVTVH